MLNKPKNIVLLGPQGSGKTTQARHIARKFGLRLVETGSIIREEIKAGSTTGKKIQRKEKKGKLIDMKDVMVLLFSRIYEIPPEHGILFDGSPRRVEEAEKLEDVLRAFGRKIDLAIYLELSELKAVERLAKRLVCSNCNRITSTSKDKKHDYKCDYCGGKLTHRDDDEEKAVITRLHYFNKETLPVVEYFKKKRKLKIVDADQGIRAISREIEQIVKEV